MWNSNKSLYYHINMFLHFYMQMWCPENDNDTYISSVNKDIYICNSSTIEVCGQNTGSNKQTKKWNIKKKKSTEIRAVHSVNKTSYVAVGCMLHLAWQAWTQ